MNYSQPNVVLAIIRQVMKSNREQAEVSASRLAEAVSPSFPDIPLPLLRVIAGKVLAVFYEPITAEDLAELNSIQKQDVNEFLAAVYREAADALVRSIDADRADLIQ